MWRVHTADDTQRMQISGEMSPTLDVTEAIYTMAQFSQYASTYAHAYRLSPGDSIQKYISFVLGASASPQAD